jgi:hypothetical protein
MREEPMKCVKANFIADSSETIPGQADTVFGCGWKPASSHARAVFTASAMCIPYF